ncbi:unnamed protein product [Onchocerca flexuosa]|uniref:(2Fe-2S)-binding protein n=1 Tax=Onchocerca flexuosa TaxID=387005 RepID=A0A183H2A7_9BILA|nr:unnamed protein product [Onchocerca flexuosa]
MRDAVAELATRDNGEIMCEPVTWGCACGIRNEG